MLRQSFDGTIQERFRERAVQCVIFLRNTARKEVKEPWFLPVLLPTFGTVAKSRSPAGEISPRVRRRETSPSAMGKSASRPETRNIPTPGRETSPCRRPFLCPGARNPSLGTPYFSGAFFIFAQVRGNWGGVSLTLRITTSRWVTSVPGMA